MDNASLLKKLDALELAHDKLTQALHAQNLRKQAKEALYVFVNNEGKVRVETARDAKIIEKSTEWELVAALNPQEYLQKILSENKRLVTGLGSRHD